MTDKELLQLFEKPEDEKEFIEFNFGDGKKHIMEKVIQTSQFKKFFSRMIKHEDEHWAYFGKNDIEKTLGSHMSWLGYLSENKDPLPCKNANGENNFDMFAQPFTFNGERYWVVSVYGQGSITWIYDDKEFFQNYIVEFPKINAEMGKLDLNPKKAYGTLLLENHHNDTLVLNWGDSPCILLMGNSNPLDMRQFNFANFACIELNGFRFVKEEEKSNN